MSKLTTDSMQTIVNLDELNNRLKNRSGDEILKEVFELAKKPIVTSKFGPNAELLLKTVSDISDNVSIVWIDVVFDNSAFRENMHRLRQKYNLKVVSLRASNDTIAKYNANDLPSVGSEQYFQLQQDLKVLPFKHFLGTFKPDFWITDIRNGETAQRNRLPVFTSTHANLIKVMPFVNEHSTKSEAYDSQGSLFNDICKPSPKLECGLHLS